MAQIRQRYGRAATGPSSHTRNRFSDLLEVLVLQKQGCSRPVRRSSACSRGLMVFETIPDLEKAPDHAMARSSRGTTMDRGRPDSEVMLSDSNKDRYRSNWSLYVAERQLVLTSQIRRVSFGQWRGGSV